MHIEHTDNDHIHHNMTRGDEVQNIQPPVGVLGTVMLLQFKVDVVHQRLHQHHGHAKESNRGEEDEEADEFVDERGIISNYYVDDSINMIGYVESKKGSIRGNHYHPVQTQKCLLIKGKYISVTKDLLNPSSVVETRLIKDGDLSTIPPNVAHTMVFFFLSVVNQNQ